MHVCVCVCSIICMCTQLQLARMKSGLYAAGHAGLILVLVISCGNLAAGTDNWDTGEIPGTAQQQSQGCLLCPSYLCLSTVNSKQQVRIELDHLRTYNWTDCYVCTRA